MNRAKTWALLAGMAAGLIAGPGCIMFDEFCDDEYLYGPDYNYPAPRAELDVREHSTPDANAVPRPAVPDS